MPNARDPDRAAKARDRSGGSADPGNGSGTARRTRRLTALLGAGLLLAACEAETAAPLDESQIAPTVLEATIPAELAAGEALFESNCATCHGTRALGTDRGPPLVHIIYEPNHHADIAFYFAVERGVRSHHWRFGDMPPLLDVNREQVAEIIAYVRYLQQQVGIGG